MGGQLSRKNSELYSLFLLLAGALILAFLIIQPYLNVLLAAGVAAIIFEPLYRWCLKITRHQEVLAVLITILVITALIIGPLVFVGQQIFEEGRGLYIRLDTRSSATVTQEIQRIASERFGHALAIDPQVIDQFIKNTLQYFSDQAGNLFPEIIQFVIRVAIGIFALYYFLKDGDQIRKYLIETSPLGEAQTRQIIDNLRLTIQATIRGSIVVAIVQAILIMLGLLILQVPNAFLWGSVGFIAALVPAFGTILLTIPVALYLFFIGQVTQGVGFLVWGIGVVGLADNLIRPRLMGRHAGLHPFLVFMSVIGGLGFFGPMGILWGPIILSLLAITLESYPIALIEK